MAARSHAWQEFSSLEAWLSAPPTLQLPVHQIEGQQEFRGRELHRLLLQTHGPAAQQRRSRSRSAGHRTSTTALYTHRRLQRRTLKTIFGPLQIDRMGYGRNGVGSIHPI